MLPRATNWPEGEFYKALHRFVHRRFRINQGWLALPKLLESAYGVHGEECTRKIVGKLTDGRDVSLYSRIDMRSGGDVSITVTGVLDAKALADAFIGSTALPQLPVR